MMSFLKVNNFALIDKLELDLKSGFNVLTGETGAGKSIIIKAVQLLLGDRASSDIIRKGSESAEVNAIFDLSPTVKQLLIDNGLPHEDETLVVRRVITSGSSKNFINSVPVTLQVLKTIMTQVVSICGQHDNQILTSDEEQLKLVDDFSNSGSKLTELKEIFKQLKVNKQKTDELNKNLEIKEQRMDYLTFQLKEIKDVNPSISEEAELSAQEQKLLGSQDLLQLCQLADETFYGEEQSVISGLETLLKKLKSAVKFDSQLGDAQTKVESLIDDLEELGSFFSSYVKKNGLEDNDLDYVINRLESLKKLKRKYGGSVEGVLIKLEELQNEYDQLNNSEAELKLLETEKKGLLKEYYALSEELHKARVKTANQISLKVTQELQDLKMSGSEFKIEVNKLSALTAKGQDQIVFMIAPNKGEGLKPLAKIASGGELSRIMLALTKVITEKLPLSLYIFDEIDAGIGGETGLVVGQKLQDISRQNQTICITHLPQVAVWADGHFVISKGEINNRVTSKVEPLLKAQELTQEIARMLGGNMAKSESLSHAQAMIKLAHPSKKS